MTTDTVSAPVEAVFSAVGYDPTQGGVNTYQPRILASEKRFVLVVGGEQGGKSIVLSKGFAKRLLDDFEKHKGFGDGQGPPLLYWLIGSAYGETIKEFQYISQDLELLGMPVHYSKRVDPGYIEVKFSDERRPRIRIETKSATDITKMSKDSPHGIIICEADQCDLIVFERAQGRATPRQAWILMAGTLEHESSWFSQLAEAWLSGADDRQSFRLPSHSNATLYPGGRLDPKILDLERHSSDAFFRQRIEGIPSPPVGLVFHEFRADLHIRDLKWIRGEHIYMWEDPGYGSESAHALEIAHIIDGQIQVFDEIYERGKITADIIHIAMNRPWWKERDDAGISLVSDPHYKDQHHSMTSVQEEWLRPPARMYASGERVRIRPGIERLKGFLKPDPIFREPKIVFAPHLQGVLSELGAVPSPFDGQIRAYKWKTDREGNVYGENPEDRYNHGLKAIIYGIVSVFGYGYTAGMQKIKMRRW